MWLVSKNPSFYSIYSLVFQRTPPLSNRHFLTVAVQQVAVQGSVTHSVHISPHTFSPAQGALLCHTPQLASAPRDMVTGSAFHPDTLFKIIKMKYYLLLVFLFFPFCWL